MRGDPIQPIPFEKARKQLWQQLSAKSDLESPESEQLREALWSEAMDRLLGLLIVDHLRAWVPNGEDWKLLPPRAMIDRVTGPPDEPSGVYIDIHDLQAALNDRWPGEFESITAEPARADGAVRVAKRRGRRSGSGSYVEDDALLILEMRALIRMRKARSPHEAARVVAARSVGGGTLESRITRLGKRYRSEFETGE